MNKKLGKWLSLVAVCSGFFMALSNITSVNVALPIMNESLKTSFSDLQWILNAYTLIFAAVLFPISKLGDILGRKMVFIGSLFIFTLFSVLCSIAPNILILIIFRGLQGIGGAGMISLSMSIIADTFEGKARDMALGIWGSVSGLSMALGPLIGGILISISNWESIFLINLPIGIVSGIMSIKYIPKPSKKLHGKIDLLGMLLSFGFMFCLILGLIQKESHFDYSWINWHVSLLLLLGFILIAIFVWLENTIKQPMLNLSMLKNKLTIGATLSNFTLGISIYAVFTYIIMLLQNYMGYSALQSGSQLMIISAFSLILGPLSSTLSEHINSNYLISGSLLLAGIGMVTLPLFLGNNNTWLVLIPCFVILGIANALVNPLSSGMAVNSVPSQQVGMASGLLNVGKQFGTSLGLVILGLTMTTRFNSYVMNANLPKQMIQKIQIAGPASASHTIQPLRSVHINHIVKLAFYHGMDNVALLGGVVFIVSAIACYLLFYFGNKSSYSSDHNK